MTAYILDRFTIQYGRHEAVRHRQEYLDANPGAYIPDEFEIKHGHGRTAMRHRQEHMDEMAALDSHQK